MNIIDRVMAIKDTLVVPGINNSDPSALSWDTVVNYATRIIDLMLRFAGILGLMLIFYAAIQYALAYGDESKMETAKKTITWAIVGIIVIGAAGLIVSLMRQQLSS